MKQTSTPTPTQLQQLAKRFDNHIRKGYGYWDQARRHSEGSVRYDKLNDQAAASDERAANLLKCLSRETAEKVWDLSETATEYLAVGFDSWTEDFKFLG